ncbi:MAG TPA: glycine zipper 2TM domain-containing protein [Ramlibacter sp.]|uniref:glycine zipper 2TM domain-containing protein n=1 Tax=Ramlibacter sp. TaxID=1917967 RepID=UPI002D3C68B0|nr:glycine zipper 2TM domain-containing protein [Ramlibacter sp.]HZY17361.1 glycine zipper 2TM domain-containing protein [Ramlibacter sp.]
MKQLTLATLIALAAVGAQAQSKPLCDTCGTVQKVHKETRKGDGGAVGIIGGAAVGGLLGNQVGKGNGRVLATVAGAAAGGYAGNEVQMHVTSKDVWVTQVRMKDGSVRTFEHAQQPGWKTGATVKVDGKAVHSI